MSSSAHAPSTRLSDDDIEKSTARGSDDNLMNAADKKTEAYESLSFSSFSDLTEETAARTNDFSETGEKKSPGFNVLLDNKRVPSRTHFSWFAFGRLLTTVAIVSSLAGLTLSVIAIRNYSFVKLSDPIQLPNVHNITTIGLLYMHLCFEEEEMSGHESEYAQPIDSVLDDHGHRHMNSLGAVDIYGNATKHANTGSVVNGSCHRVKLSLEMVDTRWHVAQSMLSLSIVSGTFFATMLFSSVCWESINLRPVFFGLLLTYFFQTLSFLLFDSNMCRKRGCAISEGSIMILVGGIMWFISAVTTVRMDTSYRARQARLERQRRRAERRRRKSHTRALANVPQNVFAEIPQAGASDTDIPFDMESIYSDFDDSTISLSPDKYRISRLFWI